MGRSLSKAIAIQRTDPNKMTDENDATTISSSMYDWATWRMYNRIVDHRQKHPVRNKQLYEDPAIVPSPMNDSFGRSTAPLHNMVPSPGTVTPPLQEEDYLDGEVFNIEI